MNRVLGLGAISVVRLLMALLLVAAAIAAPAQARVWPFPADLPGGGPGVSLPWPALGLPKTMNFVAPDTKQDFTVPLPTGLAAVRLRGLLHAPVNLGNGYLEIDDENGAFIAAVDLPPATVTTGVTPLDVDISAAAAKATSVGLSFVVRQRDGGGQFCGPVPQLTVSDLAVDFAGTEASPTTIATFFPPVLDQVTIYAPEGADAAEQQSVLTLVSTLTRIYAPRPVVITVLNEARGTTPPPANQFARTVVVERGDAGLTVVNPGAPTGYLRISGRGDELTTQVSLLENEVQSLVQVPVARVDQPGSSTVPAGDTLTFGQLKMTGRADVLRVTYFTVSVDRAALGVGRVDDVKVHLLANYTPVAKDDAATVTVRSNGIVAYTAPLDDSGQLDASFDLSGPALTQLLNLDFTVTYTPHGECGPLVAPLSFQVSPDSTLAVHGGGPALGGFSALPSEFAPKFLVAMDGTGPNQLGYAARTIAAIAAQTTTPLVPEVVDVKAAAESDIGALIVANAAAITQTSLNPPLGGDGSTVTVDLPNVLRANIPDGIGSIQAFADPARNRTVALVTTSGPWSLVNPLFDYIDRLDSGWANLTGNVLAAGPAGNATDLSLEGADDTSEAPSGQLPWVWIWVAVAVVVLVAALAAAWLVRRRRTRAPSATDPGAPKEADTDEFGPVNN